MELGLEVEYVAVDSLHALPVRLAAAERAVLGLVVFGASPQAVVAALPCELAALPCAAIELPVLTAEAAWVEVWSVPRAGAPLQAHETRGIRYAASGEVLFAVIGIDEACHVAALQSATADAYDALFTLLNETGFPHPLRFWNYLPDITLETSVVDAESNSAKDRAIERYRCFNAGRQDAFLAHRRSTVDGAPAASALGTVRGAATIYVLAAKNPPTTIENPRQVSAYRYPAQYGERSPTFSRAALAHVAAARTLFISGTASIVGHETVHRGDIAAQTEETLNNIDALLGEVARIATLRPAPDTLRLKVYLRHAAHRDAVRAIVARRLGPQVRAVYLRADVCRSDLLVEIEAAATFDSPKGQA